MNEFDAYKIYLAFKLHFTSEKYDITKTKGAVKFKKESFYKRQDQLSFQRLAEEFNDDTLPKFLIAPSLIFTSRKDGPLDLINFFK